MFSSVPRCLASSGDEADPIDTPVGLFIWTDFFKFQDRKQSLGYRLVHLLLMTVDASTDLAF